MLIFHQFPSREHADAFAQSVSEQEKLSASVHATQDESNLVDPFSYELTPPIVLVGRGDLNIEEALRARARLRGEVRGNLGPRPVPHPAYCGVSHFSSRLSGVYRARVRLFTRQGGSASRE